MILITLYQNILNTALPGV